ncbi:MAG TPA: hypothetical protein VNC50_22705, partial [Planctomycetia bacterium]|nr:hypothetical protein [Planctomycetia bacterium]
KAGLGYGNGNPASQAAGLPALALVPSRDGVAPPNGWIVPPKDSSDGTLKAADVMRIISEGVEQAAKTRAAIRLPLNTATAMVLAVSDNDGNVIGLYRMPDATFFSVDVAVAKSRNVTYYSRPTGVEPFDRIDPSDGDLSALPAGTATSNRTFRFLALPFYPTGIDGSDPGPFSILNDGGTDLKTGLQIGPPQPASDFISVAGHDAFYPGTNFRDPRVSTGNANGIVFFPGSRPLYLDADGTGIDRLVAGFGVSGDGVEQDDVVTFSGAAGYDPFEAIRADQFIIRDVRLPLNKFPRNPEARATK